jgi:hypothetical protein
VLCIEYRQKNLSFSGKFLVFDSIADEAWMPSPPENGRSVSTAHHPLKFINALQPLAQGAVETRDVGLKLK